MGSIQNEPDARDLRYLKLVSGRAEGRSDKEIARWVDGVASPRDLYEQIRDDGHPICPKCGTTYVDDTHCPSRFQNTKSPELHFRALLNEEEFPEVELMLA
jgi:hypothetical protein